MTNEESDRILNDTPHVGWIEVTIEGEGTMRMDAVGEPLRMLASQVACFKSGQVMVTGRNNNPWLLVRYDKEAGVLVVKRKAA